MIIKKRDDNSDRVEYLQSQLQKTDLTDKDKNIIKNNIRNIRVGENGEDDSAYFLDFHYGDGSKNWAIIHDLRLEINGRVAQIDHLLISRFLEFYVLETKNYSNGIKINEQGEFSAFYSDNVYGIPSPIEQNQRHITVLKDLFKCSSILPTRLGMALKPRYINYVLFSPKSIIKRPCPKAFNTDSVVKADVFTKTIDDELNKLVPRLSDFTDVAKIISRERLYSLANDIVSFHKPSKVGCIKKIGDAQIQEKPNNKTFKKSDGNSCANCKKGITEKNYDFCMSRKSMFKGKVYCFNCQQNFKG